MASPDEAAAMKRNLVHQTRLELSLKQLEKDRNVRLREMDKDTQVFLTRLGERSRHRTSLPSLTDLTTLPTEGRITSAPAGRCRRKTNTNERPQTSHEISKHLTDIKLTMQYSSSSYSRSTVSQSSPSRDKSISTENRTRDSTQHQMINEQISGFREVRFQSPLESLQENKQLKLENQGKRQVVSSPFDTGPIRLNSV